MARLFIILALVAGFIVLYRSLFGSSTKLEDPLGTSDMVQDPNCGVYIPKKQAIIEFVHGKESFFCSKKCVNEYSLKKK